MFCESHPVNYAVSVCLRRSSSFLYSVCDVQSPTHYAPTHGRSPNYMGISRRGRWPHHDEAADWCFLLKGISRLTFFPMAFLTNRLQCSTCPYTLWRTTIVPRPRCMDHRQKQSVCQGDVSKANLSPVVRLLTPKKAGANLMGADLYNNLIRYFVTHLKGLRDVDIAFFIDVQYLRRSL